MEFYDVISKRRSVRGYSGQAVEEDKLERIMEAVRQAPSACNKQPFRFLIIKDPAPKEKICEAYPQPWLKDAPLAVVALGNSDKAWQRFSGTSAHVIDVSIAMEHLVLAATAEGLATCWICAFDQQKLHTRMGIGPEWEVIALTPLGYGTVTPEAPPRKSRDELFAIL